jgi:AAA family ATP:ADP antiporter
VQDLKLADRTALAYTAVAALLLAVAGSLAALLVVRRVRLGYVDQLTNSLRRGQVQIRPEDALDATTAHTIQQSQVALGRTSLLERVRAFDAGQAAREQSSGAADIATPAEVAPVSRTDGTDPTPTWIEILCSGDTERIRKALAGGIDATPGATPERRRQLVGYVLPLLADERLVREARNFLRPIAPRAVGQLVDSVLASEAEMAVRSNAAWILGGVTDPRTVDGLSRGLDSSSFPVRVGCARALARIVSRSPELAPERERVHAQVATELEVDAESWDRQSARAHEALGERSVLLSRRAVQSVNESLEHVFTLLALVHERELVASALAGLTSGNESLRGTALELLESVLPAPLRRLLWPRLHATAVAREQPRSRDQIADELLRTTTGQVLDRDSLTKSD